MLAAPEKQEYFAVARCISILCHRYMIFIAGRFCA